MKVSEIKPWFPHPQAPMSKVYIIFDVCHMIKLMRNLLADYQIISTEDKGNLVPIKWHYVEQLNKLQEDLGFSLANKLKQKHDRD